MSGGFFAPRDLIEAGMDVALRMGRLGDSGTTVRNRTALAFLRLASIRLMLRKLCNPA